MDCSSYFDGKYKILRVLGRGGMGTVYLAENINLGTLWAIKEIKKNIHSHVNVFVEPNILKRLNHPSLPRIFDILEDEEYIYTIVDYIEGTPLDKELQRVKRFPEEKVLEWAKQICDALHYLHSLKPNPIIYRDMKPSNIIITHDERIKLIDFGIAREYKQGMDSDTVYIGTRGYAAPEQYGSGQSNVATDIYGLGVTLYHLVTGIAPNTSPYEAKPCGYFDTSISYEIQRIILKCTRQNPSDRYQSIPELLQDLNSIGMSASDGGQTCMSGRMGANSGGLSFKRLVLALWGCPEFAGELGYMIARMSGLGVLIIDFDYFSSNLDIVLNISTGENENSEASDLEAVKKALESSSLTWALLEKCCIKAAGLDNLYVFGSYYGTDQFSRYKDTEVSRLIECAYRACDVTILSVPKGIHEGALISSLERSDYNLIAAPANIDSIREYEKYLSYMAEVYGIPLQKAKFIAWEYKKGINLPVSILKRVYADQAYLGAVSYSEEREKSRNLNDAVYPEMEYKRLAGEYAYILEYFNITQKATVMTKINQWIYKFYNSDS